MCSRRPRWDNFDPTLAGLDEELEQARDDARNPALTPKQRYEALVKAETIVHCVFAMTGKFLAVLAGVAFIVAHTRRGMAIAAGIGATGAAVTFAALTMRLTPNTETTTPTVPTITVPTRGSSSKEGEAQWADLAGTALPRPTTAGHATHRPASRTSRPAPQPTPDPTTSAVPKPRPPLPIAPSTHRSSTPLIEASIAPSVGIEVDPPKLPVQLPTDMVKSIAPTQLPKIALPPLPTQGLPTLKVPLLNGGDHTRDLHRLRSPRLLGGVRSLLGGG